MLSQQLLCVFSSSWFCPYLCFSCSHLPIQAGLCAYYIQRVLAVQSTMILAPNGWMSTYTCCASSCLIVLQLLACKFLGSCLHVALNKQQLKACSQRKTLCWFVSRQEKACGLALLPFNSAPLSLNAWLSPTGMISPQTVQFPAIVNLDLCRQ